VFSVSVSSHIVGSESHEIKDVLRYMKLFETVTLHLTLGCLKTSVTIYIIDYGIETVQNCNLQVLWANAKTV